jgi:hypothetical protein
LALAETRQPAYRSRWNDAEPEQGLGDAGALHVEAGVVDVGHADAAVHLDHLVGRQVQHLGRLGLGQGGQQARVATGVGGFQGGLDARAGGLQVGEQLGRAVLQGLERADHLAELGAGLDVVQGDLEGGRGRAQHFGGQAGIGAVQHRLQDRPALADFAQHGVGADLDLVEGDLGRAAAVDQGQVGAGHALGVARDEEQGDPVAVARRAGGAGGDDQQVGGLAVDHEGLGPVQGTKPLPALHRRQRGVQRRVVRAFVDGQGRDGLAGGDLGQPRGLLGVGAAQHQGRGRDQGGGEQGRGHQVAAGLFQDQAQAQIAEGRAVEGPRARSPRPSPWRPSRSRRRVEALLGAAVAQLAQGGDRGAVLRPAFGGVAQHGLFFGQDGHVRLAPALESW